MPHFPTCTRCGVLIGDKILHDKWHRALEIMLRGTTAKPEEDS